MKHLLSLILVFFYLTSTAQSEYDEPLSLPKSFSRPYEGIEIYLTERTDDINELTEPWVVIADGIDVPVFNTEKEEEVIDRLTFGEWFMWSKKNGSMYTW